MDFKRNVLAQRLALLRKENGFSQYKLAELTGFSRGLIANYEQGRREPDYNTLAFFANFYQVSVDYLLGRVNEKSAIYSGSNLTPELIDAIISLSPDSREELDKYINLLKIRDSL